MIAFSLLSIFLVAPAYGQITYDTGHNVTPIVGTWSSGSQKVVTGANFANPLSLSFTYPAVTGLSYSFTEDGFYEIARYRMKSNGTQPNCITGVMNWCHGNYDLLSNGSIALTPFSDGYQQIQDACAPVSNFIENYDDTELYQLWNIYQDPVRGYTLQLYAFDGTPLPPMWLLSTSPNMLPTQPLRNVTVKGSSSKNTAVLLANAGERSWGVSRLTSVLSLAAALGVASLLL